MRVRLLSNKIRLPAWRTFSLSTKQRGREMTDAFRPTGTFFPLSGPVAKDACFPAGSILVNDQLAIRLMG